ncbi:unnamed protein product [Allacma fusca]|uniref:MRH domain-containing protein n=1 Tax=Allacma fusca TaxID=39272 RepID=A0A8J2KKQ1_9HEXA|nr:unnamed protein product [Allacma fusca]
MARVLSTILLVLFVAKVAIVTEARQRSRKLDDTSCRPTDYHFDFTECDASGGRWRVAIPSIECEGTSPPIHPKRLNDCYKSCRAGQFLNLTSLECEDCEKGTYSLGGGLRFEEWDPLPAGFKKQVEKFHSIFSAIGRQYASDDCSKWGWRSRGDVLLSQGGPCVATLIYSAQLVKEGSLKFTYQYSDDSMLFQFQANSDQCERLREAEGSRWPPLTGEGVWKTEVIPLRTGLNIFQWKTMGMDSHRPKPVLIKKIEIEGVGYTSSCNPCPAGTYSEKPASNSCTQCPKNTFSDRQSTVCDPCSTESDYAEAGSSECSPRPACSVADYYQVHTPCQQNQTQVVYKWVEPKICLESHPDSVKLPLNGPLKECPPCNPGTEYKDGNCQPCQKNQYSDGALPCSVCPANTVPDTGHFLTQWYSWPESIHTTCISPESNGCNQAPAWRLNGTSVVSGTGHADWVYLVMTLIVNGFRGRGGIVNGELLEVGRLSFSFEMKCAHDCELIFMQGTRSKNATIIQRWTGSQPRQEFFHPVVRNDTYTYSWAFQKLTWDSTSSDGSYRDDMNESPTWTKGPTDDENFVKFYTINVTNTIDGGAKSCVPCREGLVYSAANGESSCVSCSPGQYRATKPKESKPLDNKTFSGNPSISQCEPCPKGTVTVDPFATNSSACRSCGSGLISTNGLTCTTDCLVNLMGRTYDLRPLKGFHMVRGNSLFTASGTQYYHVFNISFCTDENAQCYKNVSLQHGYEDQNMKVDALVCQSTVFPPTVSASMESETYGAPGFGAFASKPLSTHASSLGDHLIGISHNPSINGISIEESINKQMSHPQQFHFFYSTPEITVACPQGRSTTITFRCRMPGNTWAGSNVNVEDGNTQSEITTPDKCPDGTCDGCNFHFIWETQYGCHLCTESELKVVRGECKDGMQEIHYLPSEFSQCLLKYNASWPTAQECKNHLPFAVEIAVQVAVGLTVLLSVMLICFWRRHRKLEYKYMKLVASGSSGSSNQRNHEDSIGCERGMLPVAESCALDPEDGDDDDDDNYGRSSQIDPQLAGQIKEVSFYSDGALKSLVSKFSILNKIKTFTRKGEVGSNLEIMNLTDKEALS